MKIVKFIKLSMEKIKLNEYQNLFYFIWDNDDKTIQMVNEYLKITKDENWKCLRCWDDETNSNSSDVLCISEKSGTFTSNSFFEVGRYVVDSGTHFFGYEKEEFDKKFIK